MSDSALPSGWEILETEDGQSYFYCPATGVTSWDRPSVQQGQDDEQAGESARETEWQELQTDDGTPYYFNASTGVTQWEKPDGIAQTKTSQPEQQIEDKQVQIIPAPWEVHYDSNGHEYYHNPETDETTWDRPESSEPAHKAATEAAAEPATLAGTPRVDSPESPNLVAVGMVTATGPQKPVDDTNDSISRDSTVKDTARAASTAGAEPEALPHSPGRSAEQSKPMETSIDDHKSKRPDAPLPRPLGAVDSGGHPQVATAPDGSPLDEALHPLELAEVLQPFLDIDQGKRAIIDRSSMRAFADSNGLAELEDEAIDGLLAGRLPPPEDAGDERGGAAAAGLSGKAEHTDGPRVTLLQFLRSEGADLGFGEPWQLSVLFNAYCEGVLEREQAQGESVTSGEARDRTGSAVPSEEADTVMVPPSSPDSSGASPRRGGGRASQSSSWSRLRSRLRSSSATEDSELEQQRVQAREELRTRLQGRHMEAMADVGMRLSTFGRLLAGIHVRPSDSEEDGKASGKSGGSVGSLEGEEKEAAALLRWHDLMLEWADDRIKGVGVGDGGGGGKWKLRQRGGSWSIGRPKGTVAGKRSGGSGSAELTDESIGATAVVDLDEEGEEEKGGDREQKGTGKGSGSTAASSSSSSSSSSSRSPSGLEAMMDGRVVTWRAAVWLFFGDEGAKYYASDVALPAARQAGAGAGARASAKNGAAGSRRSSGRGRRAAAGGAGRRRRG